MLHGGSGREEVCTPQAALQCGDAGGTDLAMNLFSSASYVSKAKVGLEQCPWSLQLPCSGFSLC